MILDYAAKRWRDRLTAWARCKIAGLAILLLACLWGSVGYASCLFVPAREPSLARGEVAAAIMASAMLFWGAIACGVGMVRTRNRPESHRWMQSR